MGEKPPSFLDFLNLRDRLFRLAVLYLPTGTAGFSLLFNLLIRGKGAREALYEAAFVFLIVCFIGMMDQAFRHARMR
jgi:hypothetical protein